MDWTFSNQPAKLLPVAPGTVCRQHPDCVSPILAKSDVVVPKTSRPLMLRVVSRELMAQIADADWTNPIQASPTQGPSGDSL